MSFYGSAAPFQRSYQTQSQKTFVSCGPFNTKLLQYTTSVNPTTFATVGTLTVNPSATAANCPSNRVLHATGKVLVPGANPGVNVALFGVYDAISGLNGFIDPTDPIFGNYSANMPNQYDLGISSVIATLGGQGANLRVATDSGRLQPTTINGGVNAGDASIGEVLLFTTGGNTSTVTISTSQVTPTSRIFLTQTASIGTAFQYSTLMGGIAPIPTASTIQTGFFNITFPAPVFTGDTRAYNWVVMS
jgi:hypothetical protein